MNKVYQIVLLTYVFLIALVLIKTGDASSEINLRAKRYLSFGNISHFFYRLNFKANMVPWNQIFAYALGFRMNWDEPPDSFHPYHHLQRRTVYSNLETLLDRNGLNGYHCVRRAVCETQMLLKPAGVYYKILKMVFRHLKLYNSTDSKKRLSVLDEIIIVQDDIVGTKNRLTVIGPMKKNYMKNGLKTKRGYRKAIIGYRKMAQRYRGGLSSVNIFVPLLLA